MEEQQKKETLSKLYTLRAGLSAIALEKDKADEIFDGFEEKKTPLENQLAEMNEEKRKYERKIVSSQKSIEEWKNKVEENNSEIRVCNVLGGNDCSYIKNDVDKEKRYCKAMWILELVFLGLFIIGFITMLIGVCTSIRLSYWLFCTAIAICVIFGIPNFIVPWFISMSMHDLKEKRQKYEASSQKVQKDIEKLQNENIETNEFISVEEKNIRLITSWIEDNEKEIQKLNESIEEQTLNQKSNDQIKYHVKTGEVLYDGLQQEFNALLDHRDWENLDYVIYALETGRADSMKEALQLVDRERQTDRIVKAVKEASNAICGTLADGFARLGQLVAMCSEQLTLRVKELSNQMSFANQQIGAQTAQLSNLKTYLASLTDQVSLGNALQSKANESSLKLVDEIHEMKNHSDYADWRLRKESM